MKISDSLELITLAAVWGASFLFMRIAAPSLGPVLLIELRVLLAGLTLLMLSIRLNLISEIRQRLVPLFVVGCINSAIPFVLFAITSLYLPAGFSSILNATAPLFGTLIASFWLREKLTLSQFSGLIVGFAGVTTLVGWTKIPVTLSFILAVAAGLVASALYAIAAPYAKQKLAGVSPIAVATGSQLSAAIVLFPITPWFLPSAFPSWTVILVTIALGLFSTAWAYVMYFRLISNIGASKSLIVAYLIPLFAMLWGALILGEPITKSMIVGCSLILTGTAIAVSQ
ncbi:MAG: DMT family transporter [Cyanobacteria bacterium P01_E01_bin.35]